MESDTISSPELKRGKIMMLDAFRYEMGNDSNDAMTLDFRIERNVFSTEFDPSRT